MFDFEQLVDAFLPSTCLLCKAPALSTEGICLDCLNTLPWHSSATCIQCGLAANHLHCGQCQKKSPYFDKTIALFMYQFPIDRLLQSFKYQQSLHIGPLFANLFNQRILGKPYDRILPMPMHPERLKTRGYNQSLEIAKRVARFTNIPIDTKSCKRIKDTPPQAGLTLDARIRNIKNAFECHENLTGQRVAIMDDVMTSGASMNELARTLKLAGAKQVDCYIVARTMRP